MEMVYIFFFSVYQKMNHCISQIKLSKMKKIFRTVNFKSKIYIFLWTRGLYRPSLISRFYILPARMKYLKSIFNFISKYNEDFGSNSVQKKRTDLVVFETALYIIYKLLHKKEYFFKLNLFQNCIKQSEVNLQQFLAIITNRSELLCGIL